MQLRDKYIQSIKTAQASAAEWRHLSANRRRSPTSSLFLFVSSRHHAVDDCVHDRHIDGPMNTDWNTKAEQCLGDDDDDDEEEESATGGERGIRKIEFEAANKRSAYNESHECAKCIGVAYNKRACVLAGN
jgi:hypothetical protein